MLAEVVHFLGYPVALTMLTPGHPTWRPEWEDPALTFSMWFGSKPVDFHQHLLMRRETAVRRSEYHSVDLPGIAIKSPFLFIHREAFTEAADELGFDLQWMTIGRNQKRVDASLRASLHGSDLVAATSINRVIRNEMKVDCWYDDFMEDPYGMVSEVASKLGVTDVNSVLRAAGRVQTKEMV
jgi:hypothetical protein